MEKSKPQLPTLEEALAILEELKIFHSNYYSNAIKVVVTELKSLQNSVENANSDMMERDSKNEQ